MGPTFLSTTKITLTQYCWDVVSALEALNYTIHRKKRILHDFIKWAIWSMWDLGPKTPTHPEGSPAIVVAKFNTGP